MVVTQHIENPVAVVWVEWRARRRIQHKADRLAQIAEPVTLLPAYDDRRDARALGVDILGPRAPPGTQGRHDLGQLALGLGRQGQPASVLHAGMLA